MTDAIVDAHTHVFVPDVIQDRARYVGHDLWFEHLYANPRSLLITVDDLLASMVMAGITQAVICGFPWHDLGICREHNDYLHESALAAGGRLAWLATAPAGGGEAAAAEVGRCLGMGAAGIGELNADAQRFDLLAPDSLAAVIDVCVSHDKPLLLHATEPVGHQYPGKGSATPERLVAFLQAFPELRVVLAHWGGGLPFYELMPEVAAATARVVYDSAASTYLYQPRIFRAVLDLVGSERVLWGSDHPVLTMGRFLRRTRETAGLRPDELKPVLGGNARRVYGLQPPADDVAGEGSRA